MTSSPLGSSSTTRTRKGRSVIQVHSSVMRPRLRRYDPAAAKLPETRMECFRGARCDAKHSNLHEVTLGRAPGQGNVRKKA